MTNIAHYIIFHPDKGRIKVPVEAKVLEKDKIIDNWSGNIFSDNYRTGNNEDPFVFSDKWLYSFCHATQLKKSNRNDFYLQKGSTLIFVSKQNNNLLLVDTVFVIGQKHKWGNPLTLPENYKFHEKNIKSDLWKRHFFAPFDNGNYKGVHKTVTYTYEALHWNNVIKNFSFIPLDELGNRAPIYLNHLPDNIIKKIKEKINGNRPVLLYDCEIKDVLDKIDNVTKTQVLKIIKEKNNIICSKSKSKC